MIKIIAVGDICTGDHYFNVGSGVRSCTIIHGADFLFDNIRHELSGADIVFGNLECVISDIGIDYNNIESLCFRGVPHVANSLKKAGFNLINIANNHILQHGIVAFQDTISTLAQAGIDILGLKGDDGFSSKPVKFNINGTLIGFLGYSLVKDCYCQDYIPYATSSKNEILNDIVKLGKETDLICLSLHYGLEGMPEPSPKERFLLEEFADQGVDLIIGHHSHIFQPVKTYKNKIIFYSLGNFIFDLFWIEKMCNGYIAKICIELDAIDYSLLPYTINLFMQPTYNKHDGSVMSELYLYNDEYEYMNEYSNFETSLFFKKIIYIFQHFLYGKTLLKCKFLVNKVLFKWK